jgi:DNA-directed RNA polymerase alpha subunit
MTLDNTRLRPSTIKTLAKLGITTVADLRTYSDADLLALPGIGYKHLTDIRQIRVPTPIDSRYQDDNTFVGF